jgi:hypothetical protein
VIFLPPPLSRWDYRGVPPCPTCKFFFLRRISKGKGRRQKEEEEEEEKETGRSIREGEEGRKNRSRVFFLSWGMSVLWQTE